MEQDSDELRAQKLKIKKLGRVLRVLLANEPQKTQQALDSNGIPDLQAFLRQPSDSDASDADTSDLEAVWDNADGIYRCPQCMWELQSGGCFHCDLTFDVPVNIQDQSEYTNEAFNPDRVSEPRGSTPLREAERYSVPLSYSLDQYEQLRRRGATRLMCEIFHLEFQPDVGITAWADGDIYEEFAGPLMQKGDFWKIQIGRRITLDEDDPDGSAFMEALLEDAMLFPVISACKWETVEESPGIWVTRAIGIAPRSAASDSDEESNTSMATYEEASEVWERERELQDVALAPGYVAPALPVQARHYETSDAESDGESDEHMPVDDESVEDGDDGWAWEANVPDAGWGETLEVHLPDPEVGETDVEGTLETSGDEIMDEDSEDDSADSDFDDDEVLSGDEGILATATVG
ncbi:hypothetical protein B0H11DRAFT_1103566 [Mycena galericulata]|nr:hypothetical protein B0H11DRAFT_1103566 [Mycena galericulata]